MLRALRAKTLLPALFGMALIGSACGTDEIVDFGGGGSGAGNGVFEPANGGIRRLLTPQYVNSVRYLLGNDAANAVTTGDNLPTDQKVQGFVAIGNAETPLGLNAPEFYDYAAADAAKAAVANPSVLSQHVPCVVSGPQDETCYQQLAENLGRLMFRRPVVQEEVTWITDLAMLASVELGFMGGVEWAIRGMLQSPHFLYIQEIGEPIEGGNGKRLLTDYELASRMSFFLTDTTPDVELLDAAEAGELSDPDEIRAHAERLIERPEAQATLMRVFAEAYLFEEVMSSQKDATFHPDFTDNLRPAMVEEVERLFDDIVWARDTSMHELFTADYTFVNEDLALFYNLPPPIGGEPWHKVDYPEDQLRSGLLTNGAFLTGAAHSVTTSPTRRGVFIKGRLLCEGVPPPDPDANPVLTQPEPGETPKTAKELLQQHLVEDKCANCHLLFDPYGFALEHFDAIGRYRDTDNGNEIDPTGEVDGFGEFASAQDIANLMLEDEEQRASLCFIYTLIRGNLGHVETDGEQPALYGLLQRFEEADYSMQSLLVEMTTNDAFRQVGEPK